MTDYKVFRSNLFEEADPTLYDWTLSARFCDGSVTRTKINQVSGDQIVDSCKASLRLDDYIERIFIWCGDRWWGEVCR